MKKNNKNKTNKKNTILVYFILIIGLLLIYSRYIEPYHLIVKEYKIENNTMPDSFDGLKIVHFSDVHYGTVVDKNYLTKIVNLINKQNPDIVFFTGDLIDKSKKLNDKETEEVRNILNNINSKLGNFAVTGNHDIKTLETYKKIMDNNFTIFDNEEKLLYYKLTTPISIIGLSDKSETKVNYEVLNKDDNLYRIVLAHEPDEYNQIKDYKFNVLLSGHSHNGQVRIPLIGPIYTPVGAKTYYDNYYNIDNKIIFVSNGIGTTRLNLRFNSTPSINLYRLYAY